MIISKNSGQSGDFQ